MLQSQRERDPLETNLIGSPGQQGAEARSGHARRRAREEKKKKNNNKPRGPPKLHGIHKVTLDPPLKPDLNLATSPTPFPAGLPKANVTEHTLQPEPEMLTFQTKARTAVLPGGKQDFLLF